MARRARQMVTPRPSAGLTEPFAGTQRVRAGAGRGERGVPHHTDRGAQGRGGTQAEAFSFSMARTMAATPFSVETIIGARAGVHLRLDPAGVDHRHLDRRPVQLVAQALGEVGDAGLGRGVRRHRPRQPPHRRHRGDHHQVPDPCARKTAIAASAWVSAPTKLVIAVSRLARPGPQGRTLADAGVDHDPVERAEVRLEAVDRGEDRVLVGHVHRPGLDPAVRVRGEDLGAERVERSVRRAASARSWPRAANWRAISAPSPLLAPVIRIVVMGGVCTTAGSTGINKQA